MVSITRKPKSAQPVVRARLLDAVTTMLDEGRAFTEISVEDLIVAAGVARSTFYAHFDDKGALLLHLAEHITHELEASASRWYRLPVDAGREDLRDAIRTLMVAYLARRPTLAAVTEAASYDPGVRAEYGIAMERRIAEMQRNFRAQQRAGRLRADVDVATVTPWIGWMTERGLFQLLDGGPAKLEKALDGMTTVIWNALYEGARP